MTGWIVLAALFVLLLVQWVWLRSVRKRSFVPPETDLPELPPSSSSPVPPPGLSF